MPPPPPPLAAAKPRTVRVHFHGVARIDLARANGSFTLVCVSPCTADLAAGSELRVTRDANERFPYTFGVPNDPGGEEDVEVSGPSAFPLVGGVVLAAVGPSAAAVGALSATNGRGEHGGHALLVGGGIALVVGIVLIATRSKEPRVSIVVARLAQASYVLAF
jgi:hypothetical protein